MSRRRIFIIVFLLLLLLELQHSSSSDEADLDPPPLPVLPMPSASQLEWQRRERALFLHFGMNTFTGSEWGSGQDDPRKFNPSRLNARQWVSVAKDAGFNLVILTAKHHDGFCLWPSKYTNYSVSSSQWKSGAGDVVMELSQAAYDAGIQLGLYLSPWDRHDASYGQTLGYNKHYLGQMQELLSNYGTVSEVWLDGAKGSNISMEYEFDVWFEAIHQQQPGAVIFSDAGPDVRWVGDENGQAGNTSWSMVTRSNIKIGETGSILQYLNQGDEYGIDWVPPECDVSIRPGWFWHQDEKPKEVWTLLDLYYKSVGRNCVLLLNVPPNSTGLISDEDAGVLHSFNTAINTIFSRNLAASAVGVNASSSFSSSHGPRNVLVDDLSSFWAPAEGHYTGWLQLDLGRPVLFNVVSVQEGIQLGQRVRSHRVDAYMINQAGGRGGEWVTIAEGTTIGHKRLHRVSVLSRARFVRLVVMDSRASPPLISSFGLFLDPYPRPVNTTTVKKHKI